MRIPLRSPYYSSSVSYERFYGNFDHDGRYFNYVMRKVINDTIFLLCLPDETGTALNNAKTTLSLVAADKGDAACSPEKGKPVTRKNAPLPDYCQPVPCFDKMLPYPVNAQRIPDALAGLKDCYLEPPVKPPSRDNLYCLSGPGGCDAFRDLES